MKKNTKPPEIPIAEHKYVRPKTVNSATIRVTTGCGNLYARVGFAPDGLPIEILVSLGKAGGCTICLLEGLTRVASLCLRYGVPVNELIHQLEGLQCPNPTWDDGVHILSCVDAVGKILDMELPSHDDEGQV